MNLLILGPLEVRVEGVLVPLGGAKPRAMLATLLLHPNEVVSTGRLRDALWGDQPPPSAPANIKTYASQLRKAIDDGPAPSRLQTRPPGYLFRVEPGELDLLDFETLSATGRSELERGDFELAARRLGEALSLWRGDVCADIELGPELDIARSRLDEHRMAVAEDCLQARLHRGEHRELIPELRGLVAAHPLRERLWEFLVLALSSAGRQADALAAYTDCRAAFVRELGLEPGMQLRKLQAAILANDTRAPDKHVGPASAGVFLSGRQDSAVEADGRELVPVSPDSDARGPSPLPPAGVGLPANAAARRATELAAPSHPLSPGASDVPPTITTSSLPPDTTAGRLPPAGDGRRPPRRRRLQLALALAATVLLAAATATAVALASTMGDPHQLASTAGTSSPSNAPSSADASGSAGIQPVVPSGVFWAAAVLSARYQPNAQAMVERLRQSGFDGEYWWSTAVNSVLPGYWVVTSGQFAGQADANARARALQAAGFTGTYPRCVGSRQACA